MKRAIVWYRSDLRISDHEPLNNAANEFDEVIPVYVINTKKITSQNFDSQKLGSKRLEFLLVSLSNLKANLKKLGGELIVLQGNPVDRIVDLINENAVQAVFIHKEATYEEIQEEKNLEGAVPSTVKINYFWGHTLINVEDLPFSIGELPDVFTNFRKKCEKLISIRHLIPVPHAISLPNGLKGDIPSKRELGFEETTNSDLATYKLVGGECAGLARIKEYIWETEGIRTYKMTRNELLGKNFSSKFSAYLALGCISPRQIYHEVKKFESEVESNQSTYWMIFELYWRDFFRFTALKYPKAFFQPRGIKNSAPKIDEDKHFLRAWKKGKTGIPFIDANMKELNETGFMSNRGRQNVASFLIHDLKQDWRKGAAYFEEQLIDYDVTSNWGNWAYVAGVGADPRENRYFNIMSQAYRYDEKGEYVKHWLPELAKVSKEFIHNPWRMNKDTIAFCGLFESVYENPVCVPEKWRL